MGKKPKKVAYVVFRGRSTGIFSSWAECEAQVKGFSNANFQGFESKQEAVATWEQYASAVKSSSTSQAELESQSSHLQEIGTNKPSGDEQLARMYVSINLAK